jgi:benzylsuccinate CoA-transferase BbsE subunit
MDITSSPTALAGRRVLELADATGVYCGKLLADMGADVVKVERPGGDPTREVAPFWRGHEGPDASLFFLYMNTSKRAVTLDLARPEGREVFHRLANQSDLVIETLAPGALDRLGCGFETLRADNPKLVLTSITGFGQTGPRRDWRSSDLVATALAGAAVVVGEEEDPPVKLAGSQSHIVGSLFAAVSSMIALLHSSATGRGQHVDISLQEAMASASHITGAGKWLDDGMIPKRRGTGLFASVPSGTYPCRDGQVYLMVNRPLHWQALAAWIHEKTGVEEVLDPMFEGPSSNRIPYRELLDLFISDLTRDMSVQEVYREGQRRHLAFTPVNQAADVVADEHLAERGFFVDVDHGDAGTLRYPGPPVRYSVSPWRIKARAPRVGEHNTEILGGDLGLSAAELASLVREGVI